MMVKGKNRPDGEYREDQPECSNSASSKKTLIHPRLIQATAVHNFFLASTRDLACSRKQGFLKPASIICHIMDQVTEFFCVKGYIKFLIQEPGHLQKCG